MKRRVDAFAAERAGQVAGIAQQETPPIAQALGGALVHLEVGDPSQIVQADIDAGAGIEQRGHFVRCRKLGPCIGLVAIDENKPAIVRQRRQQHEAGPARQ